MMKNKMKQTRKNSFQFELFASLNVSFFTSMSILKDKSETSGLSKPYDCSFPMSVLFFKISDESHVI
jgi:hypothetical protein